MSDFEFGDFVIVDGRWHGVVIGVRFDAIRVAVYDGDIGWWNRDRLARDDDANAGRRLAALERDVANSEKRVTKLLVRHVWEIK